MPLDPMTQHGVFSWNELMTTDVDAAKAFYGELFGWQFKDEQMPDMVYTLSKVDGEDAAGIMAIPDSEQGMPPSWGGYVTVDDVDKRLEQVVKLGGKIMLPASDIPELGRFAVIQDPQGAILTLVTYSCASAK